MTASNYRTIGYNGVPYTPDQRYDLIKAYQNVNGKDVPVPNPWFDATKEQAWTANSLGDPFGRNNSNAQSATNPFGIATPPKTDPNEVYLSGVNPYKGFNSDGRPLYSSDTLYDPDPGLMSFIGEALAGAGPVLGLASIGVPGLGLISKLASGASSLINGNLVSGLGSFIDLGLPTSSLNSITSGISGATGLPESVLNAATKAGMGALTNPSNPFVGAVTGGLRSIVPPPSGSLSGLGNLANNSAFKIGMGVANHALSTPENWQEPQLNALQQLQQQQAPIPGQQPVQQAQQGNSGISAPGLSGIGLSGIGLRGAT